MKPKLARKGEKLFQIKGDWGDLTTDAMCDTGLGLGLGKKKNDYKGHA